LAPAFVVPGFRMTETVRDTGTAMMATAGPWIGTLRERPLHASLKTWYARPGDRIEVAVDTWIVKLDGDGAVLSRRRSPRHGSPSDASRSS
jgi:hypothetical protein